MATWCSAFRTCSGRLEEVTRRAAVLYLLLDGDVVDVPFAGLAAFVPGQPDWVTALAAHCIETWRALPN